MTLADLEDRLFSGQLTEITVDRPVFVSSLPRAGTTILLNLLYETGEFVSHTYKNMPFVLSPMLWHQLSRLARSSESHEMERAHGDGLTISVQSPEAFEEMIWRNFWRSQYHTDRIDPWRRRKHSEFVSFFRNHMRKLVALAGDDPSLRYLSKNNQNISRLQYLAATFPGARIIVPYRAPFEHAASLHRQHLGFLESHGRDPFSKAYMKGIGHFDFGENFLPVNFDNWLTGDRRHDATQLEFWVEYWVAAYRSIMSQAGGSIHLFPFDRWTRNPGAGLEWLSRTVGLEDSGALKRQAGKIRPSPPNARECPAIPDSLAKEAIELFDEMNDKEASFGYDSSA